MNVPYALIGGMTGSLRLFEAGALDVVTLCVGSAEVGEATVGTANGGASGWRSRGEDTGVSISMVGRFGAASALRGRWCECYEEGY